MIRRSLFAGLFAALALTSLGSNAQAAVLLNATFGFAPLGSTTYTGATLGSATSVTIPGFEQINNLPATYLGMQNDFAAGGLSPLALGQTVTVNPLTLTVSGINAGFQAASLGTYLTFSSGTTPAFRYAFSGTSIRFSSSTPGDLAVDIVGTIRDTAGVFMDSTANVSFAFTQTTPTSATNFSATFSTPSAIIPPGNPVPEPATIGMAGTAAFLGLGYMIRKRRAV